MIRRPLMRFYFWRSRRTMLSHIPADLRGEIALAIIEEAAWEFAHLHVLALRRSLERRRFA